MSTVERALEEEFTELLSHSQTRFHDLDVFDQAVRGHFAAPYLPSDDGAALAREYNQLITRAQLNVLPLVVAALTDRLSVIGFRENGADSQRLWSWWQSSAFDTRQQQVYRDAAIFGDGFVLVLPGADGEPQFTVESPLRLAVELDQVDSSQVSVAAKQIGDSGWLYTPSEVVKFKREPSGPTGWRVVGRFEHAAGQCPVIRFGNGLDSLGRSRSELADCLSIQDRLNQTIFDRMLVQRSQSWRQRYVSGVVVERDQDGNAIPPFSLGADRLLLSENPETKFGEFQQADIGRLLEAVSEDIRAMALITRTPPHLLPDTSISNVSSETIAALESGLESKVTERQQAFGESWEATFRVGARVVGAETVGDDAEVLWGLSEIRSESQRVDAAIKLSGAGFPMKFVLERMGLSPQEVSKVVAEMERQTDFAARAQATSFGIREALTGDESPPV